MPVLVFRAKEHMLVSALSTCHTRTYQQQLALQNALLDGRSRPSTAASHPRGNYVRQQEATTVVLCDEGGCVL